MELVNTLVRCSNCSRCKTVGHLFGDVYVYYCYYIQASTYSDSIKKYCEGYTKAQNK